MKNTLFYFTLEGKLMTKLKYTSVAVNVWFLIQLLNNQQKILGKAHIITGRTQHWIPLKAPFFKKSGDLQG